MSRGEAVLRALVSTVLSGEELRGQPEEAALLGLAGGLSIARYAPSLGEEVLELVTNLLGSHLGIPGEHVEVLLRNAWGQVEALPDPRVAHAFEPIDPDARVMLCRSCGQPKVDARHGDPFAEEG